MGNDVGWAGTRAAALVPDVPASIDGGARDRAWLPSMRGSRTRRVSCCSDEVRPGHRTAAGRSGGRGRVLLFTSRSQKGQVHVLGWDVGSGQVLRVARVPTAAIAFGPGF